MKANPRGLFVALAAEAISEDGLQWVEVIPTASKARNGPWYFTVTADDLEVYAESISANAGKVPIDRDHSGDAMNRDLMDTRAAGWFTGKAKVVAAGEARPDKDGTTATAAELWAEVEWTPKARQEITDGEYRFLSPTYTFKQKDPKTGLMTRAKEIVAATLTNRPLFDMVPVTASERSLEDSIAYLAECHGDEVAEQVRALVEPGVSVLAALDTVLAAVWTTAYINNLPDSAFLHIESGGKKDADGKTTPRSLRHFPYEDASGAIDFIHVRNAIAQAPKSDLPADVQERVQNKARQILSKQTGTAGGTKEETVGDLKVIAVSLGLAEDADEESVTAAVTALKEKAEKAEKAPDEDALKVLTAQAAKGEKALERLHEMERDQFLSEAVRVGKIDPAAKEAYGALYDSDADKVKALIEALPEKSFKAKGSDAPGSTDDALSGPMRISGTEYPVDEERARLHTGALKVLAAKNKSMSDCTPDEYLAAVTEAERELQIA